MHLRGLWHALAGKTGFTRLRRSCAALHTCFEVGTSCHTPQMRGKSHSIFDMDYSGASIKGGKPKGKPFVFSNKL